MRADHILSFSCFAAFNSEILTMMIKYYTLDPRVDDARYFRRETPRHNISIDAIKIQSG